ncbi:MAG: alpha/beta hydrolase [Rhodospirillales bacterium]|nr:alpha/beta hydrolase [Rhodospirillales bacterium]
MKKLIKPLLGLAIGLALIAYPQTHGWADGELGIILMHGKGGTAKPRSPLGQLGAAQEDAGFLVIVPDMLWSRSRIWDGDYNNAMGEIVGYVKELRAKGATKIVVGGHSLGANAALGYGARRGGLAGILAIAPGHTPENKGFQNAWAMITGGPGKW